MTLEALAASAGVDASRLTELERSARKGTQAELRALARDLGTEVDDLRDPPAS
ncbi:MAG: helix-turn-helix domain-containing protein [Geminicoccales bacterium]